MELKELTLEQFKKICPYTTKRRDILTYLNDYAPMFQINTPERWAGYLSQVCVESGEFNIFVENLNYNKSQLLAIWPNLFNEERAAQFEYKARDIANFVYGSRLGNGDFSTGDGFKYRGRGAIQVTFKDNYKKTQDMMNSKVNLKLDLIKNPELLEKPEYAILSSMCYWDSRGLNAFADKKLIKQMTKLVQGGSGHLEKRTKYFEKSLKVLG